MKMRKIRLSAILFIFSFTVFAIGVICTVLSRSGIFNTASSTVSTISQASSSRTSSKNSSSSALIKSSAKGSLLMLINKDNKLPDNYTPNFTTIPSRYYFSSDKDNRFDSRAAPYLIKLLNAASKAGYKLKIISGYRSYEYQKNNFDRHVKALVAKGETIEQAREETAKLVAPPGTSEHQSGLAADIITSDWYKKNSQLTEDFDKTSAFEWLYANCANYGFILRYPKDKQSITKYEYEPWHYRFVGVDDAKKIMSRNVCLEEYVGNK